MRGENPGNQRLPGNGEIRLCLLDERWIKFGCVYALGHPISVPQPSPVNFEVVGITVDVFGVFWHLPRFLPETKVFDAESPAPAKCVASLVRAFTGNQPVIESFSIFRPPFI
jgi:hypothetical protein